jgi:putative oxidoreductase
MQPDMKNTWMQNQLGQLPAETASAGEPPLTERTREMSKLEDVVLALTRIVFALLFACHGAQKLFGAFGGHPALHNPWTLAAGILEFGGGVLIGLGLFTKPVALVLSGEMAVAYFRAHFHLPGGFWPIVNHGELAVLYCFFYLYLAFRGAGNASFDGARGKA